MASDRILALGRQAIHIQQQTGKSWAAIAEELGLNDYDVRNAVRTFRSEVGIADNRAVTGDSVEALPLEALPPGYYARGMSTLLDEDGNTEKQWLDTRQDGKHNPGYPIEPKQDGQYVKGVSTLVDGTGRTLVQWVKTDTSKQAEAELLQHIINAINEHVQPRAAKIKRMTPLLADADLMTVYPLADLHLGMYASAAETGEGWDIDIAMQVMRDAIDDLISRTPPTHTAIFANLGDYFHSDNFNNRTTKGSHQLDVDGRYADILKAGVGLYIYMMDRLLQHHERVISVILGGNHDKQSALMLSLALAEHYRNEPRIEIPFISEPAWYFQWGRALCGFTHGDTYKLKDLESIMASDQANAWGQSTERKWYTGHIHHKTVTEARGCTIESCRTLAAKDSWHYSSGYRAGRDMFAEVWTKWYGKKERHIVNASYLLQRIAQETATEGTQARQDAA